VRHTLSALVENHFGVLARVAGLFSRRGFNIESLAVGPTEDPTVSRMTIVMEGDLRDRDQMVRQLDKLVDVIKVESLEPEAMVSRELALIKVEAEPSRRSAVMQVVDVFRAKVVDVGRETLTVEITGDESKINALLDILAEFGVREMARTGVIALARGSRHMRLEGEVPAEPYSDLPTGTDVPVGDR
jgi:acetolactate synthase-1/3 small subunit